MASLALSAGLVASTRPSRAAASDPPPRKLRILILGGTGFTGPSQVRYALSRGHAVTLFNRGRQTIEWPGQVEQLTGDRSTGDVKSLEGREWDVCIDNPTTLPFWVRDVGQVLAGKVKQYVFISTISVYADGAGPSDETAALVPYAGPDAMAERKVTPQLYGALKAVSEQEARRQFGSMVTVIRPGLIVGPGDDTDRFTYWPVRLSRGGEILAPGDGLDPVQFIDARDLAEWTVRMAERRSFGTYNATGPASRTTMREMLSRIAGGVGATPRLAWVPDAFLAANQVAPWSDMPVWVPRRGDDGGFAQRDTARALREGLTFRPLDGTARDTLAWFGRQPPERQARLRAGLAADRERAVLDAWRANA